MKHHIPNLRPTRRRFPTHEGVISYSTFRQIEERMASRANVPASKDLDLDFPLRNFVLCGGGCEMPVSACWSTSRNGSRYLLAISVSRMAARLTASPSAATRSRFRDLLQAMKPSADLLALAHHMFRDL